MDVACPRERSRADQHADADESDEEALRPPGAGTLAAGTEPIEHCDPEWLRRHEQGRDAGWDMLLCPHDATVATEQKQDADDGRMPPLQTRRPRRSADARPQIQDRTCDDEPGRRHQE